MIAARANATRQLASRLSSKSELSRDSFQKRSSSIVPIALDSSSIDSKLVAHPNEDLKGKLPSPRASEIENVLWVRIRDKIRYILKTTSFETLLFTCIALTGIFAGLETYQSIRENKSVKIVNWIIMYCFTFECLLKIFSEAPRIWNFWIGPQWKWNIFDFSVVLLNIILFNNESHSNISLLYLFRLMRLAKIMSKIPQLQMILMGLFEGITSAGYILLLLFLVLYMYAVVALYFFRENNSLYYANLQTTLLTLFRAATLEDWTDIMYIDLLGCDNVDSIYVEAKNTSLESQEHRCTNPSTSFFLAPLFWVSFIVISSLIMLSLFVAAITNSMSASLHKIRIEEEEANKERIRKKQLNRMLSRNSSFDDFRSLSSAKQQRKSSLARLTIFLGLALSEEEKDSAKQKITTLLQAAWTGVHVTEKRPLQQGPFLRTLYSDCSMISRKIIHHRIFSQFVMFAIFCAAILAGIQTDKEFTLANAHLLGSLESIILAAFTIEFVLKIISEDNYPLRVFRSGWNCFDACVLVGSYASITDDSRRGNIIAMLRLLRLLRVLKVIKIFPQLQIVVNTLTIGLTSVGFIGFILLIDLYIFSIIGMALFSENDPWHFGSLHVTMMTLFRCATLEDWSDVMYINIFGCNIYGYSEWPWKCTSPKPRGWIAALYFLCFVTISALVLLTLFIGVVSTSMDEAQEKQNREKDLENRIQRLQQAENVSYFEVSRYRDAFEILDIDGSHAIEIEEMRMSLNSMGKYPSGAELQEMLSVLDKDSDGKIDLAEFISFMVNERKKNSANNPSLR